MTDTLTTDHAGSGEILHLHPAVWETAELEVAETAEPTRSLTAYLRTLPPLRALRLADANPATAHDTGELPLITTGAEVAVAARTRPGPINPTLPPPPPPPAPSRLVTDDETIKPLFGRGQHRRPRTPWSPLARRALVCWVGTAVVVDLAGLAMLAATR